MNVPEPPPLPRLSFRKIAEDVLEVVNLEKGIPYTFKRLIADPGGAIQEYLFENRQRMAKPFPLLVLLVAVAAYMSYRFLKINEGGVDLFTNSQDAKEIPPMILKTLTLYLRAVTQYFNLVYMSSIPLLALGTYLLFRNFRLNYVEHLVMNTYLFCVQTLIFILFVPIVPFFPLIAILMGLLTYFYLAYALKKIFRTKWGEAIGKTIALYFILQTTQTFLLGLVLVVVLIFG
ncbi:MAG: DUF3667 domain-containing protein [Saprospiraceae bacterium]|nr:DUF3667 domain-containing protein [Saprospiraceae bacterium]